MGNETWYRGEGAGVPPTTPGGGALLDFGDGLYLTDTEDVARQYAKMRAPQEKDIRLWEVTIDRKGLGRVLDLTADPRWSKFMQEPLVPGSKNPNLTKSRLDYLRIKYELHKQFFDEFLRANNLDIKSYDAVIGPEYVRGGKQLCLLHKNGQPTELQARIRLLFRPVAWARTFWSGKGGTAVKVGAIVVGGLVLRGLLGLFAAKVYARYAQKVLDEQFAQIRPRIDEDLRSHKEDALKLVAAGGQAFAVTVIKVWSNSDFVTDQGTTMPRVEYLGLTISAAKKEDSHTTDRKHYFGNFSDIDIYTSYREITFDKDVVEMYKKYLDTIKWYEKRIEATPHLAERRKLHAQLMGMIGEMRKILEQ